MTSWFKGKRGPVVGAAVVLAVVAVLVVISAAGVAGQARQAARPGVPLTAAGMPGFDLVAERQAAWQLPEGWCEVPLQVWRPAGTDALVEVKYAAFDSPQAALAACEAEAAVTQLIAEPGTYSGAMIGDRAWRWPLGETAGRLMFCRGCVAVSVHISGRPLPGDAAALLERVAVAALGNEDATR